MAVQAVVSKKLDNNRVVVDVKSKRAPLVQYSVPESKADEFCNSYVVKEKKENLISNLSFFGAVVLACTLITPFIKKIENGASRMTLAIVAGILAAVGSNFLAVSAMLPKHQKFLNEFDAKLVDKPTKTVNDIISK